jgi:hypothetical protein
MYCSTCGALVPAGRAACATCGARLGSAAQTLWRPTLASPAEYPAPRPLSSAVCPRCGYRGEGVSYFSRGRHLAALVLAAMFTSFAMGAGAVIYFILRRDHRVCPRCGEGWGARAEYALASAPVGVPVESPAHAPPAPSFAESSRGGWSMILFFLAAILTVGAIVGGQPGPLLVAAIAAAGGVLLHRKAETEREQRRAALLSSLQLPVLQLAAERGGRLTVTEVATQLGWTLPRAEKVLNSLEDGYRVSSDVTDDGLIVYEFLELRYAPPDGRAPLSAGTPAAAPTARPPAEPR